MAKKFPLMMIAVLTMLLMVLSAVPVLADEGTNGNKQSKLADKVKLFESQKLAAARFKAAKANASKDYQMVATPTATLTDPDTGYMLTDYFGVANWANSPALTKFIDELPGLGPENENALGQYIPVAVKDTATYTGSDYYEIAVVEYEERLHTQLAPTRLRGYVQISTSVVRGAHVALTNPDGRAILMPDGSQAYGVDNPHYLGPAIVATGSPQAGEPGKPVRIKFYNLLPVGTAGDLFIPMDKTVMGAGLGPVMGESYTQNRATVHLHGNNTVWISDGTPHQWITPADENTPYAKGVSVAPVPDMWFDANGNTVAAGTPGATNDPGNGAMTFFYSNAMSARLMFYHDHAMGITRLNVYAGEAAGYVVTDVVEQDLINGTNVSGVNPGLLHVLPDIGIPLIIQDKTFVNPATIGATDPTWLDPLQTTFGTTPGAAHAGDLWYPHVYMPAQNPWDMTGTNPFGRWMYGPWFYPPTFNIDVGPVPNEYYQPNPALPDYAPWEPPMRPGTPNPSMPGEGFMDTPLVNGTAFPYLQVEPKAYRFRILNAANDRFLNLQLYLANPGIVGSLTTAPGSGYTADPIVTIVNAAGDTTGTGFTLYATADVTPGSPTLGQVSFSIRTVGSNYTLPPVISVTRATGDTTGAGASATAVLYTLPTEVGMVPVTGTNFLPPFDASGLPDPAMAGPDWVQIGTEGGFLPAPVVVPNQPIGWNTNPTTFNFGTVNQHSLLLGSAERADVVVDFSAYDGQTLILYNDAPAPFPAPVPTYDYYTNDQDLTGNGGAPITPPGVGPNTRTIMQIRVNQPLTTPTTDVTLANLKAVWAKGIGASTKRGVFEVSQDPIIVPQEAYNSTYGKTGVGTDTLPTAPAEKFLQVNTYSKTITPIDATGALQSPVTLPIQLKAAHDEMGGVYDTGYGRMSGMLGLEMPASSSKLSQFLAYGYASPPVEVILGSVGGTLIGTLDDGTQIWNIIHNGVDTHTIHVHLFNAQLVNRVGWDGIMLPPDANELGWKETFRMNPLEQIVIALRPTLPTTAQIPFLDKVPNSVRLIDPTLAEGATLNAPPPAGWFDTNGVSITSIANHYVNFGWEYVYHCHILAHEEMDMMHGMAFAVSPKAPSNLTVTSMSNPWRVALNWTNNAFNATGFIIQRATDASFTTDLVNIRTGLVTSYADTTATQGILFYYRVRASNVVGDSTIPGFPTISADSAPSNTITVLTVSTSTFPRAVQGIAYSQLLGAAGGTAPYTWSVSAGALPGGLTLNPATGVISGTPNSSARIYRFTIRVRDSFAGTATRDLSITIVAAPTISTRSLASGSPGGTYNQLLGATGGVPPYTWSVSAGALPGGLTLNPATGVISGTPTAPGTFRFTIMVRDSLAGTAIRALSITVVSPPTISTSILASMRFRIRASRTLTATGGVSPYTWSVSAGALPGGLTLNPATGVISGTPTGRGTFSFTTMVTDTAGGTATRPLSITVR